MQSSLEDKRFDCLPFWPTQPQTRQINFFLEVPGDAGNWLGVRHMPYHCQPSQKGGKVTGDKTWASASHHDHKGLRQPKLFHDTMILEGTMHTWGFL